MRMRLALISLLVVATAGPAHAGDSWSDPFPGVRRLHRTTSNQNINVLVVDLCAPGVSVRATANGERGRTASSFGSLVGAQAVINGDFFGSGYSTNGPAMSGGSGWGGGDHGYVAPVQFGAGQVALPPHEDTGGVQPWAREVVSGHPTLLHGGAPRNNNGDPLCTNRHPRTVLGFDAARTTMYLAVIDGRATGRAGMTCDEMIGLMQGLGAHDAVNLDGGGSSTMWLAGTGVVNYPSDGSQRVVANHLAIHAGGSGPSTHCTPRYDASYVAQGAPLEMTSGDEAVVWLELTNGGNQIWDLDQTRVGTREPQDRASAFFKQGNWISPSRPTGADHSNYGPGSVGRFTWVMLAPEVTESTRFVETFQLVQEGVTWFGPTMTMEILVHPVTGPTDPVDPNDPNDPMDPSDPMDPGDPTDPDDPSDPPDEMGGGCQSGGGASAGWLLVLLVVPLIARRRLTSS
jgi:hypothetical protein